MSSPAPPAANAPSGGGTSGAAGRTSRGHSRRAKNRRYRRNRKIRSRLLILSWNAEGLRTKLSEIQSWLSENRVDVAVIQEAQFTAKKTISIPGYQTAAVTRRAQGRRVGGPAKGGDVAIYVRDGLQFAKLDDRPLVPTDTTTEWCGIRLYLDTHKNSMRSHLDIHNIYRPPIRTGQADQRVDRFDPAALPTTADSLVTGDLNGHHPLWDRGCDEADEVGEKFAIWMNGASWTTLNDGSPTHTSYRGNHSAPDVTACSRDLARRSRWSTGPDLGSDHLPQRIEVTREGEQPRRIRKTRWAFHKANWEDFRESCEAAFAEVPENMSTEQLAVFFTNTVYKKSVEHIPRGARTDPKPWGMDEELEEAVAERRAAREELATTGSPAAKDRWIAAKRHAAQVEEDAKRRSFRNFTTNELNRPANIGKVTKVLRRMEGAPQACPGQVLQGDGGRLAVADKEKATTFARMYAHVSRQVRARRQDRATKQGFSRYKNTPCPNCQDERSGCCGTFSMSELNQALRKMRNRKSPGPDDICAEQLRNLGNKAKELLLLLINQSWLRGEVPSIWRRACIVPIPKAGKDHKTASNHRPIALTSHVAKLAERMIAARLSHVVDRDGLVPPEQVGFRRGRAAEDNLGRLVQSVQDGWNKPKNRRGQPVDGVHADKFVLTAYDFSRAYDVIDHRMLRLKLLRLGVPKCAVKWIWAFLRDRRASVEVNGVRSAERPFRAGLPQGSVLSPTLYTLWAADLIEELRQVPGTEPYMYADDTTTLSRGCSIAIARERAQRAADVMSSWADRWKMKLAGEKTQVLALSQWARDANNMEIKVAGKTVKGASTLKLLGVTFDRLLHFGAHCTELRRKTRPRIAQMQKITGRTWGLREQHLRMVANGYVRGALEHAAGAWLPAASPSHRELIDRELRAAARVVTGCTRSTAPHSLLAEAGMVDAETRSKVLAARLLCRARALPEEDPLRVIAEANPNYRLKTTTGWRGVGRSALASVGAQHLQIEEALRVTIPPWSSTESVHFHLDLGPNARRAAPEEARRATAEERLQTYPQSATWVWSDGSAEGGVTAGGGGAWVCLPSGEEQVVRAAAGALCSSTRAELVALRAALQQVADLPTPDQGRDQNIIICLDSMAALTLLSAGAATQTTTIGAEVWRLLRGLAGRGQSVHFQWVPAHCGVTGNERADTLAKEAAALPQDEAAVEPRSIVRAVARRARVEWQQSWPAGLYRSIWPPGRLPGPVSGEDRERAVTIHQMRAGQWSGSQQFLHKIGRRPTSTCNQCREKACAAGLCMMCREEADTPDHVLMRCPCLARARFLTLGNIHGEPSHLRRDDVVASLAAGYIDFQSRTATPR